MMAPGTSWARAVRQQGIAEDHFTRLLAGRDDERRLVQERRHDVAHAVAGAGRRVQVHQRRAARGLGEPVRHRDDRGLLQAEDVLKVGGKILQERLFGGAWIAEDGGQLQRPQQIIRRRPNGLGSHGFLQRYLISFRF
jgi:hypothetical protein